MAYTGKYKNNFPFICAAGLENRPNHSSEYCLKRYTLDDGIQALKADFQVSDRTFEAMKLPETNAVTRNPGIFIESKKLLTPTTLSRYCQLLKDMKETTYSSYWNKKVGATPDSTSAFPEGFEVGKITFGKPYKYDCSVKDLIQPNITPYQVLWDSQINHDVYKKIYGSYNPGERIERGYKSPSFCPSQVFGKYNGYDKRGLKTKCCLEWYNNNRPITIVNEIQRNWKKANGRKIGKRYDPDHILETLPKGHTFGTPYRRSMYGVDELLKEPNTTISTEARDVRIWLVSLNRLKMHIERKISPTFDYNILQERLKFYDKEKTGLISFACLLQVLRDFEIFLNIKNIKALMEFVGIIEKDMIDYRKFLDGVRGKLPLQKIDIPGNSYNLSTYQTACCDLTFPDRNICRSKAGIPTRRLDEGESSSPCSDKYVQLSDFTDVKACLQPSILTQYSLSHRDFYCPREKNCMRKLFEKIGYHMNDENFEKLWKIGTERDSSNRVCVQTFRELVHEHFAVQKNLNVDGV